MEDLLKNRLVALAVQARTHAHVPYSGFRVGAAVCDENGTIYTGCNIENSSFGATLCAERVAAVKAVSEGAKRITAIAVCAGEEPVTPCGICRQFLSEFAEPKTPVLCANHDGTQVREYTFDALLPHAFTEFNKDETP